MDQMKRFARSETNNCNRTQHEAIWWTLLDDPFVLVSIQTGTTSFADIWRRALQPLGFFFVVLGQRMFVTSVCVFQVSFASWKNVTQGQDVSVSKSRLTMGPRGTKTSRWSVLMMGRPWSLGEPFYFSAGNACPADRRIS